MFATISFTYNVFDGTGFKHYTPIYIQNPNSEDLTDFQVKLIVDTKSLIDQGYMKSDCSDIRFVDPDNNYELPYWIEEGCNTNNTIIWIKVDSLPGLSTKKIWMVFDNPTAVSKSNGDEVFEFFDNFESGSLDGYSLGGNRPFMICTDKVYDGNYSACSDPAIGDNQQSWMQLNISLDSDSVIEFYWSVSSEHNYDYLRFYIDGSQKAAISGSVNWQFKSFSLTSGDHTLLWKYTKDGSVTHGADKGWVDRIIIRKVATSDPTFTLNISDIKYFNPFNPENFSYKLPIVVHNPNNETLEDFQVKFNLDTQKLISLGLMNSDCSDLRVATEINMKVPYWIETGTCNTTNTTVWIKAPVLQPGDNVYYVYFGNPNAKSESNGDEVFDFYRNGIEISAGNYIKSNNKFKPPVVIEAKIKPTGTIIGMVGFVGDNSLGGNQLPYHNGDGVVHDYWSDGYDWYQTMNDGSYSQPAPVGGRPVYSTTDYQELYILWNNNSVKWKYNNGYELEYTSNIPNEPCWAYIGSYSGANFDVDYIFVRKYADQEPTVEVNLSKVEPTTPLFYYVKFTISNPTSENLTDVQVPIYLNETNFNFDLADYTGLTLRIYDKRISNPYEDIKNGWNYQGIPYWIEYFKPEEKRGLIWIKLNLTPNENKTIYVYFSREEPIRFDVYNPGTNVLTDYQIRLPKGAEIELSSLFNSIT
jgi:hypothetical protein